MTRPRKVVLDVDTGTDDAVAIMFAACHPGLELVGVTTVHGNVAVENATDNTLRVLDVVGHSHVPVHAGLAHPIARRTSPGAERRQRSPGRDPHGRTLDLPAARSSRRASGAVEFLVETLRAATEPITLVPLAPLSNLATVLAVDPRLVDAVDEVVLMGGGHAVANVTASAEFNVWADPEAADLVLTAGFERLTMVLLDATHQASIGRDTCAALERTGTPAAVAASRLISRRIGAYAGPDAVDGSAPVHDVVCPASLVRPDLLTTRRAYVRVETSGTLTVGRTVLDTRADAPEPTVTVALGADPQLLASLLTDVLGGPPGTGGPRR